MSEHNLGDMEIDWESIPKTGGSLPPGDYLLNVREPVSDELWESNGKRCFIVKYDVVEPQSASGLFFSDFIFVGTDTDPEARDPVTWTSPKNRGSQRLRDFFDFAMVPRGKMAYRCNEASGHQIEARVTESANKETGKVYTNAKYFARGTLAFGTASEKAGSATVPVVPKRNGQAGPVVQKVAGPVAATLSATQPKTVKVQQMKCPECEWEGPKSEWVLHSAAHDE